MEDRLEFECPECSEAFGEDATRCPGCGAMIDWSDETAPAKEGRAAPSPQSVIEESPALEPTGPGLYGGMFSTVGVVFAVLTIVAFIGTVLILRWDTWIGGAGEETIGDRQKLFIYLGAVVTVVCAFIALIDSMRHIPMKEQ